MAVWPLWRMAVRLSVCLSVGRGARVVMGWGPTGHGRFMSSARFVFLASASRVCLCVQLIQAMDDIIARIDYITLVCARGCLLCLLMRDRISAGKCHGLLPKFDIKDCMWFVRSWTSIRWCAVFPSLSVLTPRFSLRRSKLFTLLPAKRLDSKLALLTPWPCCRRIMFCRSRRSSGSARSISALFVVCLPFAESNFCDALWSPLRNSHTSLICWLRTLLCSLIRFKLRNSVCWCAPLQRATSNRCCRTLRRT